MHLQEYLQWSELPLRLLSPEQQIQVRNQAEIREYSAGKVIWSTDRPGDQFLISP